MTIHKGAGESLPDFETTCTSVRGENARACVKTKPPLLGFEHLVLTFRLPEETDNWRHSPASMFNLFLKAPFTAFGIRMPCHTQHDLWLDPFPNACKVWLNTGLDYKSVPRFGEPCSCCCLPLLSQLPCRILATWERPFWDSLRAYS